MTSAIPSKSAQLRRVFTSPETTLMPFGVLPIHAQMAQRAGFKAFEVSGSQTAWWVGGVADVGWMTMTEVVAHAASVARSVDIPVYCDADTGYGSAINAWRTTQEFIRAGVAGIHVEDQAEPKKAGSQRGITLVPDEEAVGRLRAVCAARDSLDPDFVVVARTDGRTAAGGSLDEAIRRGRLYREQTDVDVIFFEGMRSWDEVRTALASVDGPAYAIPTRAMLASSQPSMTEKAAMGQSIEVVPFIIPGVQEVWKLLCSVRDRGDSGPIQEYLQATAQLDPQLQTSFGDVFIRPDYQDIREMENRFLPPQLRRDYSGDVG